MIERADMVTIPEEPAGPPQAQRGRRRIHIRGVSASPDAWAMVAITAAVLLANLPYLLGFFDANLLDFRGGLASAVTPGPLGGRSVIDPSGGLIVQATGHLAVLDLLHLHLPWWNPYEGTGMPLLGETESAAFFPPTLLLAFSGGQLYVRVVLELIAGVSTYLLLKRLGVARLAALAGAIAFALNGKFAWFQDATINPLPLLPLLLLGIERSYAAVVAGRPGGWRLFALAGALSVYGGFPEVAYIDTLLGVCWVAWRAGCLERPLLRAFLAKIGLGAVAGTLLAAPMLVAMGTYLTHADLGVHTGGQLGAITLGMSAVPQLVLPYVYGQINADPHATIWLGAGGYLSIVIVVLAGLGLATRAHRGLKLILLGFLALVFARMYGQPPLLGHVLGWLPEVPSMEFYRYATGVLILSVIVFAAFGLDDLIRTPAHRSRVAWAGLAALLIVAAAALGARPKVDALGTGFQHSTYFHASIIWAASIAAAVGVVALVRSARARGAVLVALLAVDVIAPYIVPELAAPRVARLDPAPVAFLRQHLGEGRFFTLGPIFPDYGSYYRLASLGVNDFPPRDYADFARARLDPGLAIANFRSPRQPPVAWELMHHLDGYRLAGVRYVLSPPRVRLAQSPTALHLVKRTPTANIYRLAGASPYFTAAGCQVASSTRESATVDCPRSSTLVRRETWFAGWTAQVDGHAADVRRVDGVFEAVTVPAGSHRVTFTFAPPGIGWALLGFLGGCGLLGAPALRRRLRAQRYR